jgi:hypothetical protein
MGDSVIDETNDKPKIYGFVNGGSPGWYSVEAISEDGVFLASHCCSHPSYGPHDIGVESDWKHETYRKYYPDGFEVIWCNDAKDERIKAAYAKHLALGKDEYAAKVACMGWPSKADESTPAVDAVGEALTEPVADTAR